MNIPFITNWSLQASGGSPYDPPEARRFKVTGKVYGSQKFDSGERITTSYLVKVSGIEIETYSGSIYRLGRPSDDYMLWCQEQGCHIPTPNEPIKLS